MSPLEHTVLFSTDTATLAVFDPDVVASRIEDDCDWWCDDFYSLAEVARGDVALLGLGGDGVSKVRVTTGGLSVAERAYASVMHTLGALVSSGCLFIGAGEELPGGGTSPHKGTPHLRGSFIEMPPGSYSVQAYVIHWTDSPEWYVPGGQPIPESAPVDIVLRMSHRDGAFLAPSSEPRVFVNSNDSWLFPDEPRRLGPEPGMVLRTSVVKRVDALVLKPCGPLRFRPILKNMAGLVWHDEVEISALQVNPAAEFEAELVKRYPH